MRFIINNLYPILLYKLEVDFFKLATIITL